MNQFSDHKIQMKQLITGLLSCLGGLFIQILIGSVYQWGIINIYITSYYKIYQPTVSLQSNQIVFPVMMFCIGVTMRLGLYLSQKYGTFKILLFMTFSCSLCVFVSSYVTSYAAFIILYSVLFGLLVGIGYMLSIRQANLYFKDKRIYVNGFVLIGTGLGPAIFGQFSYNFLNPEKLASHNGYYDGDLQYIAQKVPICIRYLALMYALIGILGSLLMYPSIRQNEANSLIQVNAQIQNIIGNTNTINKKIIQMTQFQALKSFIFYAIAIVAVLSTCGSLLVNGNYKTYVKNEITDDQYLTFIGLIGSIGNGFTRFFWSILYQLVGFRKVFIITMVLDIIIFVTIQYTITVRQLFCFMIFLGNATLGCVIVNTPSIVQSKLGPTTGNNLYGIYWCSFAVANFIQYALVIKLSKTFGFNNIFYVCAGMSGLVIIFMIVYDFEVVQQKQQKIENQRIKQENSDYRLQNIQIIDKNGIKPEIIQRFDIKK